MRARLAATTAAMVVLAGLVAAAPGASTREIGWQDLVPESVAALEREAEELERKLAALPPAARRAYDDVALELVARDTLATGQVKRKELSPDSQEALARQPSLAHPEALAFWTRVKELKTLFKVRGTELRSGLDGQPVRIPGYLLPLEFEGAEVSQFLLVPYVGACIHVPPPPANQMVFVKAASAFENAGMYTPVWVEGTIFARPATHELSLVDGRAPVDAGYTLEATKVEPYGQ